eukprot:5553356-Heterocapsa_arctica.AAC.1
MEGLISPAACGDQMSSMFDNLEMAGARGGRLPWRTVRTNLKQASEGVYALQRFWAFETARGWTG